MNISARYFLNPTGEKPRYMEYIRYIAQPYPECGPGLEELDWCYWSRRKSDQLLNPRVHFLFPHQQCEYWTDVLDKRGKNCTFRCISISRLYFSTLQWGSDHVLWQIKAEQLLTLKAPLTFPATCLNNPVSSKNTSTSSQQGGEKEVRGWRNCIPTLSGVILMRCQQLCFYTCNE